MPRALGRSARFDFRSGVPDAGLFPYAAWRRLLGLEVRAKAVGTTVLGDPAGHRPLREAIARHLGISRAIVAGADDVLVTNGTQQGLDLLGRVWLAPGNTVAVEHPGYGPPRFLLETLGARVVGVPVDGEGLMVDALPADARLVYVTPSHQYPLGMMMSLARRGALLAWAARHDAAVIEDDYDTEFRFGGQPIEPLRRLDAEGRVAYLGSFSKTLLPGLRLGFVVTPPSLREALHRAKYVADWSSPLFTQQALARFIDDGGLARHLRKMNRIYGARRRLVMATLARDFRDWLELLPSEAGLHLAARALDPSVEAITAVARRAAQAGVAVQELSRFGAGRPASAGLILGYGAIATDDIGPGLARLQDCFGG